MIRVRLANESSPPIVKDGSRRFFSLIFVALLLLDAVFSAGIASAFYVIAIVGCLFSTGWRIERKFLNLIIPFLVLFLFGIFGAIFHPLYDVIKDVWYLVKIICALGVGYLLMHHLTSLQQMIRLVIVAAVIAATLHLFQTAWYFQASTSLFELRNKIGGGYFVTVLGLGLLVGYKQIRKYIGFDIGFYYLAILLCVGSLVISMSRTNIVSFILVCIILRGWVRPKSKSFLILGLLGGGVAVMLFLGGLDSNRDETSLINKFSHSITEVSISDYGDLSDINANWRGFEGYRANLTYLQGNLPEKLFGQGFGSLIDLGFYMPLGGSDIRYLPIIHNGYMYLLIKFGFLGVLIYFYFIFKLIRINWKISTQKLVDLVLARRLISSFGWVFLVSTLVITGVFNKSVFDSSLIILGATMAWLNLQNKPRISSGRLAALRLNN
ncbi:MAG: O-antigen ligase family protein [Acidovorax soli]|uniref:O-antigen ligase family protein n=1 Tax=Acidovorax soli TaxID=592050 RepID=UPI0026F04F29|nr:O-antigen ligase family protein [Acidovorax soli]MCM2345410.1 O-antigen ligase family protein [Acidovorax soli]